MKKLLLFCIQLIAWNCILYAQSNLQTPTDDSIRLNYRKIDAHCLNGEIRQALELVNVDTLGKITAKDKKFVRDFKLRFNQSEDRTPRIVSDEHPLNELVSLYLSYWRTSFFDKSPTIDSLFKISLSRFLSKELSTATKASDTENYLDSLMVKYIRAKGFNTAGFGRTGGRYDLLVWKTERDTVYSVKLKGGEKIKARVIFMDDFVSNGWQGYASIGRRFPGGWTTGEAIYSVTKGYNLKSEQFRIGLVAHEARHFADYKLFPGLESADLEYRAKLVQMIMGRDENLLYSEIAGFIAGADEHSQNSHSAANFRIVRDMSMAIFKTSAETDINKWKGVKVKKINRVAYKFLKANTRELMKGINK